MEADTWIGKRLPRPEAPAKAIGAALYTGDLRLPGMLSGAILRSPLPHARILHLDTSRAERLLGVKAIITGRDEGASVGMLEQLPETFDKRPLVADKVRYIGDEVAAVAALDEDIALEALELIRVEYEPLPAVFDPEEALAPETPLIHESIPGNLSAATLAEFGNVEAGFRAAYHIREDRFVTPFVQHAPLEPHISLAHADPSGRLTLWSSTQTIFLLQRSLAHALGMPVGNVRVIRPHVGGAFGGKIEMLPLDFCAALLSKRTGRPVRIGCSREEEFAATRRRHAARIELKTGVTRDGEITAKQARILLDGGAYCSVGPAACFLSSLWVNLPYRQPCVRVESRRVYTNQPVCGAMRGFGSPQVHFAAERQMDLLAADLGLDPLEIRLKNALRAGDVTPNGLVITSSALEHCLREGARISGWTEKRREARGARHGVSRFLRQAIPGKLGDPGGAGKVGSEARIPQASRQTVEATRPGGIGIGCGGFICGTSLPLLGPQTPSANLLIEPRTDGTVTLLSGVCDLGQGSDGLLLQIVAQELGLRPQDVRITLPDTEISPSDLLSASSRVTYMAGNAARAAAADLRWQLFQAAAEELGTSPEALEAAGGRIFVHGQPERGMSFSQAVAACQEMLRDQTVVGRGSYNPECGPLDLARGRGNYSPAYSFGVQFAEVEVDPETGKVRVVRLVALHDCGVALNPMAVEGQLEGSIHMGLGFALSEWLQMEGGQTLNPNFLDYKLLTALDMPEIRIELPNLPDPGGPYGAKEAGEGTVSPTAAAVANALCHALGIPVDRLPFLPEELWAGLLGHRGK